MLLLSILKIETTYKFMKSTVYSEHIAGNQLSFLILTLNCLENLYTPTIITLVNNHLKFCR